MAWLVMTSRAAFALQVPSSKRGTGDYTQDNLPLRSCMTSACMAYTRVSPPKLLLDYDLGPYLQRHICMLPLRSFFLSLGMTIHTFL